MKKLLALIVAVVFGAQAYGGVTLLSEEHHVYGEAPYYSDETYDISDIVPISGGVLGANSSAGDFSVFASTGGDNGRAGANSSYTFTVDQSKLTILFEGHLWSQAFADKWGHIGYKLTDYETKETLYTTEGVFADQSWSLSDHDLVETPYWHWVKDIDESPAFLVEIGHKYTLDISASVTNADGSDAELDVTLIPEPCTLLLLGLGGLAFQYKRNQ